MRARSLKTCFSPFQTKCLVDVKPTPNEFPKLGSKWIFQASISPYLSLQLFNIDINDETCSYQFQYQYQYQLQETPIINFNMNINIATIVPIYSLSIFSYQCIELIGETLENSSDFLLKWVGRGCLFQKFVLDTLFSIQWLH